MKITEGQLRDIIRKCLMEALDERGTNMDTLYHFTSIWSAKGILRDGFFITNDNQPEIRNGKNYVSFTRHKSNLEGFADARGLSVRIEVDGRALSNLRNGSVDPFEYYSTNRRGGRYGITKDSSAKSRFAASRKDGLHGESDYMSQAEESFTTEDDVIPIRGLVRRIDIDGETCEDYCVSDEIDKAADMAVRTGFGSKVFIYARRSDFNLQNDNCITADQYVERMRGNRVAAEEE